MFKVNYKAAMGNSGYKTLDDSFTTREEAIIAARNLEIKARTNGAFIGTKIIEINEIQCDQEEKKVIKPIIIYNMSKRGGKR